MSRLFGTDGIRGVANVEPLTTELAFRLGRQLVATLLDHHGVKKVAARRRPRHAAVGPHARGRARLRRPVRRRRRLHGRRAADAGHRASSRAGSRRTAASCCPPRTIRSRTTGSRSSPRRAPSSRTPGRTRSRGGCAGPDKAPKPTGAEIGRLLRRTRRAETDYVSACARAPAPSISADMTIVLDCAHGATYRVAPKVFRSLGARVIVLGARPDGQNINREVGALHPEALRTRVLRGGRAPRHRLRRRRRPADLGGRARRDPRRRLRARHLRRAIWRRTGRLTGGVVVTTVMANLGLDKALREAGIRTVKTQVGDRYVLEEMLRIGANLGGEQSGHLLFLDHSTTGDGIVSALQLLGGHAGDRATAVRAGGVPGQVPAGARQRAGQGASRPFDEHSRPCRRG